KGEALYSAVVVRYTGGTFAEDVNKLAAELATLNDITDVTDMPVGQRVRIPFDLLLPEFLPPDDPRRVEYDKNRSERDKYSNTVRASRLEGVTVILDAGHGGQDPGAQLNGTWESIYVYDITLRVKRLLEASTAATVVTTTRDGSTFEIPNRDVLSRSRGHKVLTTPPYAIADAKIAANLRWYLANSQHAAAVKRSGDANKTVFLSIHADSLPRSHRGAMIYIPAASLTRGSYAKTGSVYSSRREYKEKPRVEYSWKERTRSEGLSRQLAKDLLQSFERHGLAIYQQKPIRDRIIRCRRCRPWVPAVVRYNAVPAKLLLEVCNLNNSEDRRLLQTRAFRQQMATAIVDAILAYYGQSAGPPPTHVAR
ncbi:MAG: N-acetylmuramoyl-L-alanine amidase, partial [Acidobacteriota bacterium]